MIPRKLLAIKLRALGDTVLMTAPLLELRRAYPNAEIHVAVESRWAPLLENHPAVDKIWPYVRHSDKAARAKAAARLAIRLRDQHFDAVVNFHASPSSAMVSRATGARVRSVHFHGHKDKNQYSTVNIPGKGTLKPIIERDMDTVRALGLEIPEGQMPVISLKQTEIYQAVARIQRDLNLPNPILGLTFGASRVTKSWPIERFAAVAVSWCKMDKGSVFAFAGPDEAERMSEFLKAVEDIIVNEIPNEQERFSIRNRIVSETSVPLRQLAALLSRFAVFLGNDSGPKHVAVAVGTPTVTVFGPEDPFEWHPYPTDKHPYLFVKNLECRKDAEPGMPPWCGVTECREQHKCMELTGVAEVLAECRRVARRETV
ncbi:MAG: hypothetical protein A2X94_04360 [Bdellovibrionales bacterium GWB1_55_8]|nr:MAG: hypothetical protein A2X94_04360 [Bdellovibrionales bacterium GWB1_55_8]